MKNPYRSLEHRPLRTLQVCMLLAAMFIKIIPGLYLFFDLNVNPAEIHRLTLISILLAITCLLDLGTLHSLTYGFSGLLERPWFVLFTPAVNAILAGAIVALYGVGRLMVSGGNLPWWVGPTRLSLVAGIVLVQVASALVLFVRLRSVRPFPR